jgi:hypothetical protein
MVPDFVPLYAVIVVLFALIYFLIASITFLFVRLDIPEVARLFRGLFNAYFLMVGATSLVATAAFAASGRFGFAVAMLLLAATARAVRGRTMQRIDAQQNALDSGDSGAVRQLRLIHLGGMAANVLVLSTVASSLRLIL